MTGVLPVARILVRAAQAAVWVPVAHLGLLSVAGALRPEPVTARDEPQHRFVVVICGRDEQAVVTRAVVSVLDADYPAQLRRVVVVADNCTDATAEMARAAGADAWERHDLAAANKGAALAWAFERLLADDGWDAVVVLDADGSVAPDLFAVLDVRLADAAVLQAERRVGDPSGSLVNELSVVSSSVQTVLRPRARQRLGGAAKLVGTGMVFRRDVLQTVPWQAQGLVEDLEYWLRLLERGIHPRFEPRARVTDLMPDSVADARRQRERWQAGRSELVRRDARSALGRAVLRRDVVTAEAVLSELLLPTLSVTGAAVVGGVLASLAVRRRGGLVTGALQAAVLAGHVLTGLRVGQAPASTYRALAVAPAAAAWKVALAARMRLRPRTVGWQGTRGGSN